MRIGFTGLGMQGAPIARRILAGGYELSVYSRHNEVRADFAMLGAKNVNSNAELGAHSDVVGVCVVNDEQVREVVTGTDGLLDGMAAGSVILVHTTAKPETCRELAALAAERGVTLCDCTVSGGPHVAERGEMLAMFGGDADVFERVRPVLATFSSHIEHVGPVGSGQIAKLVNNLVFVANLGVADEALRLGERLGLDRGALAGTIVNGSGGSWALQILAGAGSLDALAQGAGSLLRKDIDYVIDVVQHAGLWLGAVQAPVEQCLEGLGVAPE